MNVTLYIELEGYDDGDFDVRNDYYKSDDAFFDAMDAENKRYSDIVYGAMSSGRGLSNNSAKFGSLYKTTKNAKVNNYKSEAILLDENGKDETVDNFIANCVSQDVVVNIIKFNREKMDEEFEEDLNFWIDDHNTINKYKGELGEDKVWENEPTRNLKVEFINNAGETKYAMYVNCKVLEQEDNDEYAILAEKIILLNEI